MSGSDLRAAIAVRKSSTPSEVANAAAIVMGQLALLDGRIVDPAGVMGADGVLHAGIRFNTVILTGRQGQLTRMAEQARVMGLPAVAYSQAGRSLSNSYEEYCGVVTRSTAEQLDTFAIGVVGPETDVRALTRTLSAYQ